MIYLKYFIRYRRVEEFINSLIYFFVKYRILYINFNIIKHCARKFIEF